MAQRLVTESLNTVTPGAYPEVNVKSTPVGIASGGAILIIAKLIVENLTANRTLRLSTTLLISLTM